MSWLRATAALFTGAVLLIIPQVLPASAATHSHSYAAAKPSAAKATPLIQGVVTDQFGSYVDDVKVQAIDADGDVAATSLTYASAWDDGPQHGYFFLEVGAGTYTVTLSKAGYERVEYDDIEVASHKVSLGEVQIEKVPASTVTSAVVPSRRVTTRDRASVVVAVTADGNAKPTGTVEVREGKTVVGSGVLKAGNRGSVTLVLNKLGKGGHVFKAYFLGSQDFAASSTKRPFTLMVAKSRK